MIRQCEKLLWIALVFWGVLSHADVSGQDIAVIDSLKTDLAGITSPEDRVELLGRLARAYRPAWDSVAWYGELAWEESEKLDPQDPLRFDAGFYTILGYSYFGHPDRIIDIGEELLPHLHVQSDTMRVIQVLNMMGAYGYYPQGQVFAQIDMQEQALDLIAGSPNFLFFSITLVGNIWIGYKGIGMPWKANMWIDRIFDVAKDRNDSSALSEIYLLKGAAAFALDTASDWMASYRKAYSYFDGISQHPQQYSVLEHMGQGYLHLEKYDSAKMFFELALDRLDSTNLYDRAYINLLIAKNHHFSGDYPQAEKNYRQVLDQFASIQNKSRVLDIKSLLGEVIIRQGRPVPGRKMILEMIDSSRASGYLAGVERGFLALSKGFEYLNDWEETSRYKDSLLKVKKIIFANREEELHELRKTAEDYQRTMLNNSRLQVENLELEAKSRNRTYWILIAVLVSVFVVIIAIILLRNWQRERKLSHKLDQRVREQTRNLSETVEQVRAINEDLKKFTFLASHNFKSGIRTVKSVSDLLARLTPDSDRKKTEMIGHIQRAGRELNMTLNSLVIYFDLRDSPIKRSSFPLEEVVREVISSIKSRFPETHAEVKLGLLPQVHGSRTEFEQLFFQLVDNAFRYHPEGQTLSLEVFSKESKHGQKVCIRDNGMGIPREYQEQIFEAFQRLHGSDVYEGTGMGLAIARRIVTRHGGSMFVESTPGEGSCFCVVLPHSAVLESLPQR